MTGENMKNTFVHIPPGLMLLGLLAAPAARADTALTINSTTPYACFQNANILPIPLTDSGTFTLPGVSGTGIIQSRVGITVPTFGYPPNVYGFAYSIDMSGMSATANHCVRLLIHFGTPEGCGDDTVWGSPSQIQSATLAPFGDITFVFSGGCLVPAQPVVGFSMYTAPAPKYDVVTVIDDYVDPANGKTNEVRINVSAIVPDIAPNPPPPPPWVFIPPFKVPWFIQGFLGPHTPNPGPLFNGTFDLMCQLVDAPTNGYAVSEVVTQTVQVANGLFNLSLPFDPISVSGGLGRWLNLSVRTSSVPPVAFTPLNPPLAITPTPQAFYAYTAGTVADLAPGQAVTSLNGLTDAVILQAGNGISLGTNGNTLTIIATGSGPSDRNLKTDFAAVNPGTILSELAALPMASWRFTNDAAGVRHLGPMAQDFRATFGLGRDDKTIGYLDASGVALAAIQGLNQKVNEKDAEIQKLKQENETLEKRLGHLEQTLNSRIGVSH
jgi:hypothetical protein